MAETEPIISSIPPLPAKTGNNSKLPTPIALIAAALLFFLPFLEVRCNGMVIKSVTGVELATGFKIQSSGTGNGVLDNLDSINKSIGSVSDDKQDAMLPAQLALGFAILGFLIALSKSKIAATGTMIISLLGLASMVWLFIDVKEKAHAEIGSGGQGVSVSVDPTPAFYITAVCFLAAAYFAKRRSKVST